MKKIFLLIFLIFVMLYNLAFAKPIKPDAEENSQHLTEKYKEHFLELWNSIK